ncbi:MAG: hypothetical protein ACKO3F_06120 [Cyanobium sp.]
MQQQILERRPPRLLNLEPQADSSGPGALDLRFSRPMQRQSLAEQSRVEPRIAHRWLGSDALQRLLLLPDQVLRTPLALRLRGIDRRGMPLPEQRWNWDPRPHLLVVAQVDGGEQLQLLTHAGTWLPLSPVWPRIPSVEPLASGRGVVLLAADPRDQRWNRLWKRSLRPRSLVRGHERLGPPLPGALEPLWPEPLSFAQISSNRRGDLVLQLGGLVPGSASGIWIEPGGRRHKLNLEVSGPIRLLPSGDGMVVPSPDGLELRGLREDGSTPQMLPGSRVLVAFCSASGEALLMRHWPDYRRSLERVQPGAAPVTTWLGVEAVMAASCNPSGDRVWMLLSRWQGQRRSEVVRLDRRGRLVARRDLAPWQPEPGTALSYDPVGDQLLLTVRRDPRLPAQPAFLDGATLRLRVLSKPISQSTWLPAG